MDELTTKSGATSPAMLRWAGAAMKLIVAGALLVGCRGYQPGSFSSHGKPFQGTRITQGCIEMAVASNQDAVATGAVARFSLANRCDRATRVDFTQITARVETSSGEWQSVSATDPRGELRPVLLEARSVAIEYLEFAIDGTSGTLCLQTAGLTGHPPSEATRVCLDVRFDPRTAEVNR